MTRLDDAIGTLLGTPDAWITTRAERPRADVISPLDGSTVSSYPICEPEDVRHALGLARRAQASWSATPPRERAAVLARLARHIWDWEKELLDLIQGENGKVRSHAFEELSDVATTASHYAKHAPRLLGPERVPGAVPLLSRTTVHHHPVGIVAVISPWNYPLTLAISDAVAALAAGNAVVVKPDSNAVLCALAAKALLERAGLPADLFQVVPGPGSVLGPPLIEGSDYLMFTGSSATGRILAKQAGEQLIGFSAELGGKNPLIVLADAPMRRAVKGAVKAVISNSGQLCISTERIYIEETVWDRFVPAFVRAMRNVRVGADYAWATDMGPLISADQLAVVTEHVEDARAKGATVLAGGQALPHIAPHAYAPTVLTDVTDNMIVARSETFGPVVSLYRVRDAEDAIARANDSEYGLKASIWTKPSRGQKLGARLEAGIVSVNDGYVVAWGSMHAPMGGMKASGIGRRHGEQGLLKYTEPQTVATSLIHPIQAPPLVGERAWARVMKAFVRR
ncbi:succinic semialdehyde dehydrogenase [Flaviflexus salsibiostraticola]|uniref:succinic semialdehyde dehydrogenase n=1 Tax=Flaviflexus salsibiostraticola TaxID=1282737 RepID=UPI0013DE4B19|nr:succinic semialdehyde dehydrogenase [Flaviflexus salsibiostraticola]